MRVKIDATPGVDAGAQLAVAVTVPTMGGRFRGGIVVYDFEELARTVLPFGRTEMRQIEAARSEFEQWQPSLSEVNADRRHASATSVEMQRVRRPGARRFSAATLAWDRLHDLRRLAELREWYRGAPRGWRNTLVFLGGCFLAVACVAADFDGEVRALSREFAPDWTDTEMKSCVSSVVARLDAAANGQMVSFNGTAVDPRYRFSNGTLVEMLQITASEQEQMKTIIGPAEKRARNARCNAALRRRNGALTREEYLSTAMAKRERARELRGAGMSIRRIAEAMNISAASVSNYCRGC